MTDGARRQRDLLSRRIGSTETTPDRPTVKRDLHTVTDGPTEYRERSGLVDHPGLVEAVLGPASTEAGRRLGPGGVE